MIGEAADAPLVLLSPPPGPAAAPDALVVEDDEDVAQLLRSHLRRLGWSVRLAASGEEGVALAFAAVPDLVLVDVGLPGIDGTDVVRTLRSHPLTSGCALVLTTVLDCEDLVDLPVDGLLPKPFSRRDVERVLATLARQQLCPAAPSRTTTAAAPPPGAASRPGGQP